jgi:hypothetical protein
MISSLIRKNFLPDADYFKKIYDGHLFGNSSSASGPGSTLEKTKFLRQEIQDLIQTLNLVTIGDVPCGDLAWMSKLDLDGIEYTGYDIVPELIDKLRINFPEKHFDIHDATNDVLRSFDLIICRDLLVHLTNEQVLMVLDNFRSSGSRYLLTTTFTSHKKNQELRVPVRGVGWRPINLELEPYCLGKPVKVITEVSQQSGKRYSDKSLGLWKIN